MFLDNKEKQNQIRTSSPEFLFNNLSHEMENDETEGVEEITRVPTPPPLPPAERSSLGPDNIPGPPEEIPVKLDEDPVWDPIRSYLPSLLWLEQFKPGLIKALFDMVNTLSHGNNHECTLKRVIGLKDRFALSSEIYDLPKLNEASSQTNIHFPYEQIEASTQTINYLPQQTESAIQNEIKLMFQRSIQTNPMQILFSYDNTSNLKTINMNSNGSNCNTSFISRSRNKNIKNLKTPRLCWNCRKAGHPYSNCTEIKRIFCHMCGRHGYTTKTCPNCRETWRAMGPYHSKIGINLPRRTSNFIYNRYNYINHP
ncbi:uncharacterized protein LOC127286477 [Leptopilina boulardi]|uniref:uncharacterized protein LOC127286477 n=1 Tax=Leptopilina boulardi TaxID=63433 RepID=UPI0021F53174|nr:uncharacterized protein LOC127286477 [Leptopilina boulardi]XP_051168866.1 uncharacterized protein LOC127286477 [Leptopilina boulardi]XP_051168867.1 uncharacterized protein LOC127286477 [Leptopilina boulardi]XP_051168868.1 uncharacterized protein LOC127286477 [Leptopilina boulardi]